MTYIGVKVPHNILKRAWKKYNGKNVNIERDERLWELADEWVTKTIEKEDLDMDDLPSEFNMTELLKAVEDIHGREMAADVYDNVDMDEKTESQCEWVLNETKERGFHTTVYHDWVMEAFEEIDRDGDDSTESHFGICDITNFIRGKEQGATQICVTLWSQAEELGRRDEGHIFKSESFSEMNEVIEENKELMERLFEKLDITEEELPRDIEIFTGVST